MQEYFVWSPNPIAVDFGLLQISWYGLTWSLSILTAYFIGVKVFKNEDKNVEKVTLYIQYVFIGAVLGARIFDVLYYHFDQFIARPMVMFEIMNGGLSSHGAMIGVVLALLLFAHYHTEFSFAWSLERSAMVMPLLGGLVRIGNFINSELYGKASELPWAVVFPLTDAKEIPRHPVQLYEALWLFACFALFWVIYKKKNPPIGLFSALFLIVVLGGRMLLEFFKDSSTYYGPLSNTQWLSLLGVLIGLGLLYRVKTKQSLA
jgi:phosphatidylglycerol:prolipoprotein diacylglycerol transferase